MCLLLNQVSSESSALGVLSGPQQYEGDAFSSPEAAIDLAGAMDPWLWKNGSQPLGTRMWATRIVFGPPSQQAILEIFL